MARGKGEGTIVKRTDGRYQASLQVNGRRRTVYGRTRQDDIRKKAQSPASMNGHPADAIYKPGGPYCQYHPPDGI